MNPEKYIRVDVTLPNTLLARFKRQCTDNGMKVSSRIAVLIKRDLEEGEHT